MLPTLAELPEGLRGSQMDRSSNLGNSKQRGQRAKQVRGGSEMAKEWCAFSPPDMFLAYSRLSGAGFVHLGYLIVNGLFRFCFTPWELYPLGSLLLYSPKDSSVWHPSRRQGPRTAAEPRAGERWGGQRPLRFSLRRPHLVSG